MSGWVKVMNSIRNNPKVQQAGSHAFALYIAGLCYANEQLTDGYITERMLPVVFPVIPQPKQRAKELVEAGLWEVVDGGWQIHDYLDVQSSAQTIRDKRKK